MRLSSGMKNLSDDILVSFKQRIKENEELVSDVQKTLDGFQKDHQDMAVALRSGLAKVEKNRLQEADILMKKITKEHKNMATALRAGLNEGEKTRLKEFVALMKNINEEISEIFTYTHSLLEKSEVERLEEFAILIKSINEEVLRIFSYTHDLLARFDKEYMEMSVELRKNLSDGEVERINEFNVVMTGIRIDVKRLKNAVAELLGDYAQDREGASSAWKKMSEILTQLRNTAATLPKQAVKKEVKPAPVEAKVAAKVAAVEETPVEVQPKVEAKAVIPMTLEDKVTDYINKHPQGVRISEMEEPLGETRMKLGFVAKNLLDEGKVQKVENIYFPIK